MNILTGLAKETWRLLAEMAPYLLFGFLFAGLLHLFLRREKVIRHLAQNDFASVLKASLFGIPLPLCSCAVIPVAAHLEKQGAGRGPVLSFLISTPTTGVDSILATYSLLGPLLAILRPLAALFNGLLAGGLANLVENRRSAPPAAGDAKPAFASASPAPSTLKGKLTEIFRYSFDELLRDSTRWLIIGIITGGAISYFVPAGMVEKYLGNPLLAYPLMLLIGLPMYVCATGSIPIAASLILKGMSPGAGFIFLFAGPATSTAALSFVGGKMGKKSLALYLATILFSSLLFGGLIDTLWSMSGQDFGLISGDAEALPGWFKTTSALILLILFLRPYVPLRRSKSLPAEPGLQLTVPNMNCEHCKMTIDAALRGLEGVEDVKIDVSSRQVQVVGTLSPETAVAAIEKAGYAIKEKIHSELQNR